MEAALADVPYAPGEDRQNLANCKTLAAHAATPDDYRDNLSFTPIEVTVYPRPLTLTLNPILILNPNPEPSSLNPNPTLT